MVKSFKLNEIKTLFLKVILFSTLSLFCRKRQWKFVFIINFLPKDCLSQRPRIFKIIVI